MQRRPRECSFEPLEPRRLLSCVIDLRLANGGGKAVQVTAVNQVVNLEVWAVITGSDNDPSNDGFQSTAGSFLSAHTSGGSVNGDLLASNVFPFDAAGAQPGTQQDLNGDGDKDVGSNDTTSFADTFNARAGSFYYNGVHNAAGNGQSFLIATVTYTVTNLSSGAATDINYRRRVSSFTPGALWTEDGVGKNEFNGAFSLGDPVVITGPATPTNGSISGNVFRDANRNGVKDPGETNLANITVYIDANNNNVLDKGEQRTTTDSSGNYTLGSLPAGTYFVRQVVPAGYQQINPVAVPLSAGQNLSGANFADAPLGSIAGNLFNDLNGDSGRQTGEPNLSGRKFYIDANKNGKLDSGETTATTDSNGNYKFSNLAPGTYRIRENLPSGWGVSLPTTAWSQDVVVASGQNVTGKNFADTQKVFISGNVFNDINANGSKGTGEAGLSGWRVYIDLNNDGKFETNEPSALTDANGNYKFLSLSAGTYRVRVTPPSGVTGYKSTTPSGGLFTFTLSSGGLALNKNFGEHKA